MKIVKILVFVFSFLFIGSSYAQTRVLKPGFYAIDKTIQLFDLFSFQENYDFVKIKTCNEGGVLEIISVHPGKVKGWYLAKKSSVKGLYYYSSGELKVTNEDFEYQIVSNNRTYYTKVANPTSDKIKEEVKVSFEKWLRKDEFEKTSDYLIRVSSSNRDKKLDEITKSTYNEYKARYISKMNNQAKVYLGSYDADSEFFEVTIFNQETYLNVPIDEAKSFKSSFSTVSFSSFDLSLNTSDEWILTKYKAHNKSLDKFYYYRIEDNYSQTNTNLTLIESGDLNIDIPYENHSASEGAANSIGVKYATSDVNVNIPKTNLQNTNTFCLIIGNEDYSSRQVSLKSESNVPFAIDDAKYFSIYANKTLGIPQENIFVLYNATKSEILQKLDKLTQLSSLKNGRANLLFFYAGHGLPDQVTKEQYLIPVDVSGANLKYAIKVNDIISRLSSCNAKQSTIVLDACFSGGARNQGLVASRGVKVQPKSHVVKGNVVVFTSSSGSQTSKAYEEKQHGMFTYFILKKLQETQGDVDYEELFEYVKKEVEYHSILKNDRLQSPEMNVSQSVYSEWMDWGF